MKRAPTDATASSGRRPRGPSLREVIGARVTAVLRACGEEGSVAVSDIKRVPTSRSQRDLGVFSWYARVRGQRFYITVGSQLTMKACSSGPLYIIPEPLTESFHLMPPAEWPRGLVAPEGGVLGVRVTEGRVRWHDASGAPLPATDSTIQRGEP